MEELLPAWALKYLRRVGSLAILVGLDVGLRQAFKELHTQFPSSFAGMLLVVTVLMATTPRRRPGERPEDERNSPLYWPLKPGKDFLLRWIATFFAPGMIAMPRTQSGLRPADLAKLLFVSIFGFEITLYTTAKCADLMDKWLPPVPDMPGSCPLSLPRWRRVDEKGKQDEKDEEMMMEEAAGGGSREEPEPAEGGSALPVASSGSDGDSEPEQQETHGRRVSIMLPGDDHGDGGLAEGQGGGGAGAAVEKDVDDFSDDGYEPPPPLPQLSSLRHARSYSVLPPPASPFTKRLHVELGVVSLVTGIISTLIFRLRGGTFDEATSPVMLLHTFFTAALTLFCYVTGARAPPRFRKAVNPIISCCLFALLGLYLQGLAAGKTFNETLDLYFSEKRSPLEFESGSPYRWIGGGGDLLFACLQPSVLALGVCTYENRRTLLDNSGVILGTMAFTTVFSLFSSAALSRAVMLSQPLGVTTMARNITTPLAVMVAEMLKADVIVTLLCVFVSGLYGVAWGTSHLRWYGLHRNQVAKGLATGVSCHGLGTASLIHEPEAMAFSAVGFLVVGIMTLLFLAIPPVRDFFNYIA